MIFSTMFKILSGSTIPCQRSNTEFNRSKLSISSLIIFQLNSKCIFALLKLVNALTPTSTVSTSSCNIASLNDIK